MFKYLFAWPDQLPDLSSLDNPISKIAVHIRRHELHDAQKLITVSTAITSQSSLSDLDAKSLLYQLSVFQFFLYSIQGNLDAQRSIYSCLQSDDLFNVDSHVSTYIRFRFALDQKSQQLSSLVLSIKPLFYNTEFPFCLLYCEYLLLSGDYEQTNHCLQRVPSVWNDTLEYSLIRCYLYEQTCRWDLILDILLSVVTRSDNNPSLWSYLLIATIEAKSYEHAIPVLRAAIAKHGYHPLFYSHFCRISLLKFRSADARRYSIKDRLIKLTSKPSRSPFLTNLWVTQERLGYVEWINFLPVNDFLIPDLPYGMLEPLMLQNASINGSSDVSKSLIKPILSHYDQLPVEPFIHPTAHSSSSSFKPINSLRIAWISSDISHHPVARFLLGFFSSVNTPNHNHFLVDINDHGPESLRSHFNELSSIDTVNCSNVSLVEQIRKIREMNFDIAIDLNGWTGSHILKGFTIAWLLFKSTI